MYFGGDEEPYKAMLFQAFEDKVWGQNGDDALKIVILYFIHRFILSGEMHTCNNPELLPSRYTVLTTLKDHKLTHELVPAVSTE
ncbi:hypothetical protein FXO38_08456 [Capsicum annuum]|uniref:Uncharacterized protein n=1 Tax=Capsicum annuum TaxID=4072 RepID=A0A2G3AL20_CAPAN|nr:hypothetical protein FXO38_08456 [Capsicum annuum]PHT94853.1 hypothetical protein T459_02735 [Capsicum annuum]